MNVNIWGPPTWEVLHASAFLLDMNKKTSRIFFLLNELLPCMYCRESYVKFYAKLRGPSLEKYAYWLFLMHNLVNKKLSDQRIEKIASAHPELKNISKFKDLFLVGPTELVTKKRFMVDREEPLVWRSVSTMLLAFSMAAETGSQSVKNALKEYVKEILDIYDLCPPSEQVTRAKLYLESLKGLEPSQMRVKLEELKYGSLKSAYTPRQISELIRAHTCFEGSCI